MRGDIALWAPTSPWAIGDILSMSFWTPYFLGRPILQPSGVFVWSILSENNHFQSNNKDTQ